MTDKYDWDDAKAVENFRKHSMHVEEARDVFDDPFRVIAHDARYDDEDRFLVVGESLRERILVVAFVERTDTIRVLSARKATRSERREEEGTMASKVATREKPFRQATKPTNAELKDLFKTERDALAKQAKNYIGGLDTLEGLESAVEEDKHLATCNDPKCPNVQGLSIDGWDLEISDPSVGETTYSSPRPVGDPESPRGFLVSATFEIKAFVSGTIWFSYWCV